MTGCSYCMLNDDDKETCAICEASYINVYPYDRCIREDGTLEQRNCHMEFYDGICLLCGFGYYLSSNGCVRNTELEYTHDLMDRLSRSTQNQVERETYINPNYLYRFN